MDKGVKGQRMGSNSNGMFRPLTSDLRLPKQSNEKVYENRSSIINSQSSIFYPKRGFNIFRLSNSL